MLMLPVAARWQPPETGTSAAIPPAAATSPASRRISSASVVDISIQTSPGRNPGNTAPSITAAEAAGLGRQVITTSSSAAIRPGSLARAPSATCSATSPGSRSCTARSTPFASRFAASFAPRLPSPMNPTRIARSPVSSTRHFRHPARPDYDLSPSPATSASGARPP